MPATANEDMDSTAARVALWRALHVEADAPPHVFEDEIGLQLVAPPEGWRERPDMNVDFTRAFRASIVARARFVEDQVEASVKAGVDQYVILGAGIDTFVQRRPEFADRLRVYEIDRPAPQAWKRRRLEELGCGLPPWLTLVPVDFEAGQSWGEQLARSGFDRTRGAVVSCLGVSMYLTQAAIAALLREVAGFAPGSVLVMSFLMPIDMAAPEVRPGLEIAERGARASGTPFLSHFMPEAILALARDNGLSQARHVSSGMLAERYFAGRDDALRPPEHTEELLLAFP